MRNLDTQSTDMPDNINGTTPPTEAQLIAAGWRHEPAIPAVEEGYSRQSIGLVEGDGRTGTWQIVDRLTSEIEAEAAAAQAQAEIDRQAAKSDALKHTETAYLTVCQQLTGSRAKLGFAELEAIIGQLMATDKETAVALTLKLLTLDAAGKREGGLQWWDDIYDHAGVTP